MKTCVRVTCRVTRLWSTAVQTEASATRSTALCLALWCHRALSLVMPKNLSCQLRTWALNSSQQWFGGSTWFPFTSLLQAVIPHVCRFYVNRNFFPSSWWRLCAGLRLLSSAVYKTGSESGRPAASARMWDEPAGCAWCCVTPPRGVHYFLHVGVWMLTQNVCAVNLL